MSKPDPDFSYDLVQKDGKWRVRKSGNKRYLKEQFDTLAEGRAFIKKLVEDRVAKDVE